MGGAFAAVRMFDLEDQVLDVERQVLDALVALFAIFLKRLSDDTLQLQGCVLPKLPDRYGFLVYDCRQRIGGTFAAEWYGPGEHLVQDHAQAPDVGTLIDRKPACLLGRHIAGAAHHGSGNSFIAAVVPIEQHFI